MVSLIARLVSTRERKNTTHHTFSVLRRNQDLFNEPSTGLRSLVPAITHILAPRPTLHLVTETTRSGFESLSSSACPSSAATTKSVTPATTLNNNDDDEDDEDDDDDSAAPSSPWTCPPSAVPWPPQICAAPLSTHHRLAPCAHVVRTPFLTPCGSNCAHVFVATNQPPPSPSPSSVLTPATPHAPLLPFVVDAPFTCAVCVDAAVCAEKDRRMGAFGGLLERNKEGLLDGEREVVAEAHERILAMEMAEERGRVEEELGGRACEAAEERDGHGRCCP